MLFSLSEIPANSLTIQKSPPYTWKSVAAYKVNTIACLVHFKTVFRHSLPFTRSNATIIDIAYFYFSHTILKLNMLSIVTVICVSPRAIAFPQPIFGYTGSDIPLAFT